jgi:hypothetical protein
LASQAVASKIVPHRIGRESVNDMVNVIDVEAVCVKVSVASSVALQVKLGLGFVAVRVMVDDPKVQVLVALWVRDNSSVNDTVACVVEWLFVEESSSVRLDERERDFVRVNDEVMVQGGVEVIVELSVEVNVPDSEGSSVNEPSVMVTEGWVTVRDLDVVGGAVTVFDAEKDPESVTERERDMEVDLHGSFTIRNLKSRCFVEETANTLFSTVAALQPARPKKRALDPRA